VRVDCAAHIYIHVTIFGQREHFSIIYAIETVIPREVGMEFYCCGIFLDTQRFLLVFPWGVPSYYYYGWGFHVEGDCMRGGNSVLPIVPCDSLYTDFGHTFMLHDPTHLPFFQPCSIVIR